MTEDDIPAVADLMAGLKPEWWDRPGAERQLRGGQSWFLEDGGIIVGFLLGRAYPLYKTVEIECLGFDSHGALAIGAELTPLVSCCEDWAKSQGAVHVRFVIGSRGLSCHLRPVTEPWRTLKNLAAVDRPDYLWFLAMGYSASGILPNLYGSGHHGIILVKQLPPAGAQTPGGR